MFIFRLSSIADRIDPYWYCRLIGIKAVYLTIVVFAANTVLKPPLSTLIMLFPAVGALIVEMPTINDFRKKDYAYLGYLIIIITTLCLFGAYVYMREWFIVAASAWCYILYTALRKAPQLFAIVSVILMLGIISLEALNTGNFYIILNEVIFILEFSVIVFWAHKFFPNFYHMVWTSAALRMTESMIASIDNHGRTAFKDGFKHYLAVKNIEPLLKEPFKKNARELCEKLSVYNYFLAGYLAKHGENKHELNIIKNDLTLIVEAVKKVKTIPESSCNNTGAKGRLNLHNTLYRSMLSSWRALC